MKSIFSFFLFLILSYQLSAQDFTSKDNTVGNWKNSGTWIENSIPSNTGDAGNSVHIFGKVTLDDNLLLDNNNVSEVTDTLWIRGNLTISNGSSLSVNPGGVLIVDGVLYINEGFFTNSGLTVITYYEMFGGELTNNSSSNELYAIDKRSNYIDYGTLNSDPIGSYTDFENNHPILSGQLANGTLPIKLLSFKSTVQNDVIYLEWITAWEENFDFFTIERAGSNRKFHPIGTIKGKGSTSSEAQYGFTDHYPLKGQSFYRLKATDFDGSFEHHKIISTYLERPPSGSNVIYPNPVTNRFFTLEAPVYWVREVKLLASNGKVVYSCFIQNGAFDIRLPEQIKPGAYLLILIGKLGQRHQQKIVVL